MTTENNNREMPPIPGGGSWTFNYDTWEWDSNHPVPPPDAAPAAIAQAPFAPEGEE